MAATGVFVGIGEVLWDIFPKSKRLGGAPANFVFHSQSLGMKGYIVSAIGTDDLGKEILKNLKTLKLSSGYIEACDQFPTGAVTVDVDNKGVPSYLIREKVAWDHITWNDDLEKLAKSTDAVCFGSLAQRNPDSRHTINRFLEKTPQQAWRIFDVNLRQHFFSKELIENSLNHANILKLNEEEMHRLRDMLGVSGSIESQARSLLKMFDLRLIAITLGTSGSLLVTRDVISSHPGTPTEVADTVGAGDAFTATLATGLFNGAPLDVVNKRANRVASFVCSQDGATPQIPHELKW